MKHLLKLAGACLCAAFLAACSGSTNLAPSAPVSVAAPEALPQPGPLAAAARPDIASSNLYVANYDAGNVTVYGKGGTTPVRTISDGVSGPVALAFSSSHNLFVANNVGSTVTIYPPGSSSPSRTISEGISGPSALAFDGAGRLYVANANANTVTVYAPGSSRVVMTISQDIEDPVALAIDRSGNLYVGNLDDMVVYPGSTVIAYNSQTGQELRTLDVSGYPPYWNIALALDKSGNLYVADKALPYYGEDDSVVAYAAGTDKFLRSYPDVHRPDGLAFDAAGNLYVSNWGGKYTPGKITVYVAGGTTKLRTIYSGINRPQAIAVNRSGNVYLANSTNENTVTVYEHGSTTLVRTISGGISNPVALAFGP